MSAPHLDAWSLALAASLLLSYAGISLWLHLGLVRTLLVAAIRATVQLALLATVLVHVFAWKQPWAVVAVLVGMAALASREVTHRAKRRYPKMGVDALVAVATSGLFTGVIGTAIVIRVEPWWEPRFVIPLTGMILGNALTGVSVGVDRFVHGMHERRRATETALTFGATSRQAAHPIVRDAVRAGLIPIVNTMSVVGVVSIPGMMTGQILGGASADQAARYQLAILFLIAAATAVGCTIGVVLARHRLFDSRDRLRLG